MAQRPQPLVRESVVVAALFGRVQPDPAEPVPGVGGRHVDAVALIDNGSIGGAGAVCHPHARAGVYQRFKGRDQSTG